MGLRRPGQRGRRFRQRRKTDIAELAAQYEHNPLEQIDSLLNIALRQDANPAYTLAQSLAVTDADGIIASGDFNGDGAPDLAAAHWTNDRVFIFINDGTGQFAKTELVVDHDATCMLAVDITERHRLLLRRHAPPRHEHTHRAQHRVRRVARRRESPAG